MLIDLRFTRFPLLFKISSFRRFDYLSKPVWIGRFARWYKTSSSSQVKYLLTVRSSKFPDPKPKCKIAKRPLRRLKLLTVDAAEASKFVKCGLHISVFWIVQRRNPKVIQSNVRAYVVFKFPQSIGNLSLRYWRCSATGKYRLLKHDSGPRYINFVVKVVTWPEGPPT